MSFLCDNLEESCRNALSQRNVASIISKPKQVKNPQFEKAQIKEKAFIIYVDKGVFLFILFHHYGKAILFMACFDSLHPNFPHSKQTSNTK